MSKTREALLATMRAMAQRTTANGCTEAEALAFAEKLGKLMLKHGFEQADLAQVEEKDQIGLKSYSPDARSFAAVQYVTQGIGVYCDCKVWRIGTKSLEFYGHEPDALLAQYLVQCFDRALMSEWRAYRETSGFVTDPVTGKVKQATSTKDFASFGIAMMSRISDRLVAMKREQNAATYQRASAAAGESETMTGTALVVQKMQAVEEAFSATFNWKLGKARSGRRKVNYSAYSAGRAAGDRVQITTGIGGSRRAALS